MQLSGDLIWFELEVVELKINLMARQETRVEKGAIMPKLDHERFYN